MDNKKSQIHINIKGPATDNSSVEPINHIGFLGKFFGGVENAPAAIGAVIIFLLIFIAALITFFNTRVDPMEFWKTITLPLITGFFGYLFGKQRQK